jgi:hypothetical protein
MLTKMGLLQLFKADWPLKVLDIKTRYLYKLEF